MMPPLTVAAVPVPGDALADEPEVVAEADLPLDRALVEIVGRQRRVGRVDDRRVEAEAVRHVAPVLDHLRRRRRAAARISPGFISRMIVGTLKPIT